MNQLIQMLSKPDQLLVLFYISVLGSFTSFCFKQHTSFYDSMRGLLGGVAFGFLAGYLLLDAAGKWAKILSGLFSLFAVETYKKLEKAAPKEILKRFLNKKDQNE